MSDILRRRTDRELEAESRRSPGARLRWLRKRAGLTMGELARVLGCEVTEVSSIERGLAVHPGTPWLEAPDNDQVVALDQVRELCTSCGSDDFGVDPSDQINPGTGVCGMCERKEAVLVNWCWCERCERLVTARCATDCPADLS